MHRDLKLSNILLTEDRTIKIADFGLAVQLDCQAGDCDTVCGTPNYLAPEVFNKQKYGLQADLWSLGCIIYGCLVGVPPFESLNLKTTFKKA